MLGSPLQNAPSQVPTLIAFCNKDTQAKSGTHSGTLRHASHLDISHDFAALIAASAPPPLLRHQGFANPQNLKATPYLRHQGTPQSQVDSEGVSAAIPAHLHFLLQVAEAKALSWDLWCSRFTPNPERMPYRAWQILRRDK